MEFDIRDQGQVLGAFKEVRPDVVVHTASIGNVDYCERNRQEAARTNVEGSMNMIEAARRHESLFLFMSSNAVFDGQKPPYGEEDKPSPIDCYGRMKLQTEQDLAASGLRYAIARLMTMYGWNHPLERQNPVTWTMSCLKQRKQINVVDDIYNNHLYADSAAQAVWAIITKNKQGIFHIAGSEAVSRYELAQVVADVFGLDQRLIKPVKSSFVPSIAPRPKNTSYDISKMQGELSVPGLGIKEGLAVMRDNPPKEWDYEW
jgi:dTDP-4-dehydrorhamnose reductase